MGVEGSASSSSSETVDDSGSEPDNSLVFQVTKCKLILQLVGDDEHVLTLLFFFLPGQ